jgi:gliding motility-associated-like protein
LLALLSCAGVHAQIWNTGMADPILNVSFGDGAAINGPPLQAGRTSLTYSADACPARGQYTLAKTNKACADGAGWDIVYQDHTFKFHSSDYDGYMMIAYGPTSFTDYFYRDTVRNLCSSHTYLFTAWTSALGKCGGSAGILYRVETLSGKLIAQTTPGAVNYVSFKLLFGAGGLYFDLPPGETGVVLKLINVGSAGSSCGNRIGIDDIQLRITGKPPAVDFGPNIPWVKSVCYRNKTTVTINGDVSPSGFMDPAMQWQQSTDSALSWQDIPGATGPGYSGTFSEPDTFFFRIRASEAENIGNAFCSVVSNILEVAVDGPPVIKISSNSPLCSGQQLSLRAEGFAHYEWTGPNGFYDNIAYPTIYHTVLADSGFYYAEVSTLGGCKGSDSTYVRITGTDIQLSRDTSICKGSTVQLQVTGGSQYSWLPAIGLSDPSVAAPRASPEVSTTYEVTVKDQSGCTNSGSVSVRVLNAVAVKAAFSTTDYVCKPSDTASFRDESMGNIASWDWDLGNGQTSILSDPPIQKYTMSTNTEAFQVSLSVTDTAGCSSTAHHLIKVADNCFIAVPTAFTPNGDGLNDYLYPVNAYRARDLIFRVYNRNGKMVFESKSWTNKWNGNYQGLEQDTGVYIWILNYTSQENKKIYLRGKSLLLR